MADQSIDPGYAAAYPRQTGFLLSLAQFQDWQSTFQPIELQAMQQISLNDPAVLDKAVNEAESATRESFGTLEGVGERQNRALGVNPTPEQQTVSRRLMDLSEASSMAGAANTARANVRKQDRYLLFGGAGNPNVASPTG